MKKWIPGLLSLYLVGLLAFWLTMRASGDLWWGGTLLLFGPRWWVALPLLLLVPGTLVWRMRLAPLLIIHMGVILIPICGFRIPWHLLHRETANQVGGVIRVMTVNVGGGHFDKELLRQQIQKEAVDVVAIQECSNGMAAEYFEHMGWNYKQWKHLAIGTRLPILQVKPLVSNDYDYQAGVAMQVTVDTSPLLPATAKDAESFQGLLQAHIVCTHQPTPRPGIEETIRTRSISGEAIDRINEIRQAMARQTSEQVAQIEGPVILCGDFNTPADSPLFLAHWKAWTNAFHEVGSGFGWTKMTRYYGIRIDHVLHSDDWSAVDSYVGEGLGGDHRPVVAVLARVR